MVLPIIEEEIEVGRRVVETGKVRLTKHVNQWEEEINESVLQEEVEIERVPVNRLIDAPADIRNEGGTTIIPVMEEVLVVEKRIRLKEEVHITLRRTTSLETQRVTVRKEEVDVERVPGNGSDRV
ncbi:MAG: YsnF/AvaK domain-containing protein [Chloroflexaceae bacterium]|nr:YsnF/AvaK domain-containing protein [Chloroflexaceae bacterium]